MVSTRRYFCSKYGCIRTRSNETRVIPINWIIQNHMIYIDKQALFNHVVDSGVHSSCNVKDYLCVKFAGVIVANNIINY